MLMMGCLGGDFAILILVKDSEGLLESGQVVRSQRFKDSFSVGLTKSGHTTWKIYKGPNTCVEQGGTVF